MSQTSDKTPDLHAALRLLNAVAETLASERHIRFALERTLRMVADWLEMEAGWIWLLDPETGRPYSAAVYNLPPYLQEPVRMTGKSCWCLDEFAAGRLPPRNIGVMKCSRLREALQHGQEEATRGLQSHASVPLYFQYRPLGILNMAAPAGRSLSNDELRLLSAVASQVGVALERARLADEGARLAQVEERTRLAREIHDTLAQSLTGVALHIEGGLTLLETDPARARERLNRALTMTRESLDEARRSVLSLRSAPLDNLPLPEALAALGRSFTADTGIRVASYLVDSFPSLAPQVETELYRIAQEALANVRQHAIGATVVSLHLNRWDRSASIRLFIADNGAGFPSRRRTSVGGQGIPGMRERVRSIGGSLSFRSRSGKGVAMTVTVPVLRGEPE